jgi:hypothetical protein
MLTDGRWIEEMKNAHLFRDGLDEWIAVFMATGCGWHDSLHLFPDRHRWDTGIPSGA